VPILVLVTLYGLIRAVARNAHYTPFLLTLVLIFLGYSGLGISLWPNIIPPSISIWDAAAPPQSQGFMLVGTLFIIPFILGTPSGATTCSAARSPMKTVITRRCADLWVRACSRWRHDGATHLHWRYRL
jgi:hypothetical protein